MINWKLKMPTCQPIGLDIGHNSIKMIQLVINEGHISVLAADKVRIDPAINGDAEERRSFVISTVKQMLAEGNFRGRNVISCLPSDRLKITSLRVTQADSDQIEQVLRKEVAERFGLDPETDTVKYLVAGNVTQGDEIKNELILFAADNETIKSHIEMLEEAQLKPVGIDTVPFALLRSFKRSLRRQEDKEQTVVFVDVGSQFTTVVFGRGGEICFAKQIRIGGEKFDQEIAAKLGISINEAQRLRSTLRAERSRNFGIGPSSHSQSSMGTENFDAPTRQVMVDSIGTIAEELAREISLCFRYYTVTFRGKRIQRAVLAGGEAYENILLNVLKRQLAVEIEVAQPLRGFEMTNVNFDSDRRGLLCEWAVAVGLGLKGWNPESVLSDTGNDYERN